MEGAKTMSLDFDLYMELDTGGKDLMLVDIFSINITHNLIEMASEAGLYQCLWHPEQEVPPSNKVIANQLIKPLATGLFNLKNNPEKFKKLNPVNGWGTYEGFIQSVSEIYEACLEHPKANVKIYR